MKTLNRQISDYTELLRRGELQRAYKGILDYMGKLRSDFASRYPEYAPVGSIYQGYMDMSYFSVMPALLKEKGLKIAIVYLHEKCAFEVWLSARNRETLKKYRAIFESRVWSDLPVFHDPDNEDAVIEYLLTSEPDFEDQPSLTKCIETGTEEFISAVIKKL